jgi:hypothetical protein
MKATIIGSGNMARGIGTRLRAAGLDLQILDRTQEHATALAGELGATPGRLGGDAVTGDIVVLAVPYPAVAEIAGQIGDQLDGRIVIDITNPVDFDSFDRLVTPPGSSAAEEIAKLLPGARVIKAFNTTFAGTLVEGQVGGQPLDVFLASDDTGATKTLDVLIERAGLRPVEVGPLRRARELEAAGFLHMTVQQAVNGEYGTALRIAS